MPKPKIPVFCVVSYSRKSGKTSIAAQLISLLSKRGFSIFSVKHASKQIDVPGKDTSRLAEAGAKAVMAISPQASAIYLYADPPSLEGLLNLIESLYGGGIAICEGFKQSPYPKIYVNPPSQAELVNSFALVYTNTAPLSEEAKAYPSTRLEPLCDRIVEASLHYVLSLLPGRNCGNCGYSSCRELAEAYLQGKARLEECSLPTPSYELALLVNGEEISLSRYPSLVISSVLEALTKGLKGVPREYHELAFKLRRVR